MRFAEEIIQEALANDIVLYLKNGLLAYVVAPGKKIPDTLKARVAEHKENIIEYLRKFDMVGSTLPSDLPGIVPRQADAPLALSFAQQRLWFHSQLNGADEIYNIPAALHLRGRLDTEALRSALDALLARHEALRTVFVMMEGQPQVRLLPSGQPFPLHEHDLQSHPDPAAALQAISSEEARALFDLSHGPLIRARAVRLAPDDQVLLITQHHIVSDGWSLSILINEFSALYAAFVQGRPSPLPPLAVQYPDYAAWQRQWLTEERLAAQLDYWSNTLVDAPVLLALPTVRPRSVTPSHTGVTLPLHLDAALAHALKQLSQRHDTTLFMTLMAAWAAVLGRLAGQDDVVIGTPSANRNRHEIEPLVGFFVNTLALRIDLSGDPSVATLLERVRIAALAAQDHQDVPFEQVVERVNPPRRFEHAPIFQVMFTWQNNEQATLELPGLQIDTLPPAFDRIKFDLQLTLSEIDDGIEGIFNYATDLFDAPTIERQRDYLLAMLRAMVAQADQPLSRIDLLAAEERSLLLYGWNQTDAVYPAEHGIHQLFEDQVRRTPEATALVFEEQSLSYAALNAQANRLAHYLVGQGVRPDERVAICVERSLAMVVGLLAILKAGGAYVPLDPGYPAERLGQVLGDADPVLVLADASGQAALGEAALRGRVVLELDRPGPAWSDHPATDPDARALGLTSRHLAYVIYTSGSTGTPKGTMVEHRSAVNFWQCMTRTTHQSCPPHSVVALNASFSFDMSLKGILQLLSGHALTLIPQAIRSSGQDLLNFLVARRVDVFDSTPSQLRGLLDAGLLEQKDYRPQSVLLGGEPIEQKMWDALRGSEIHFHNMYGPTECTVDATIGLIRHLGETPSIGRSIANTRLYLLDAYGQPVPLGAVGELYIGGVGVARGYLNRPELTAERFLADPFCTEPEARMYRTGDLARYLPDGNLVFLGRNDHQVKLRGFRIELGEIEARLVEHPDVREAVVLALGEEANRQLVAYVVRTPEAATDDLATILRTHLAACLPEYMVPAAFVSLDALPLTPNGKLDRRALPDPSGEAFARRAYAPPQGEIEIALTAIWQELLGIERVGRHDHFFELGGHSLLAVRLLSRLGPAFAVELPLTELFSHPVLSELAAAVIAHQGGVAAPLAPITPTSREGALPLSFAQQRLWFLAQLDGVSTAYHLPAALHLQGALDVPALHRALDTLLARHEALRTVFVAVDGQPQVQLQAIQPFTLIEQYLQGHADPARMLAQLSREEARAPFDLAHGPLIRGRLIRLAPTEHMLLLTLHHIVSDGWSRGILVNEFSALYGAFVQGRPDPLPPLAVQYPDYAAWQHQWLTEERLAEQLEYWRNALAGAPVLLALPTDRPRSATPSYAGASLPLTFDIELTQALKRLSQRHDTTLFMLLVAAWAVVLARLSGQEEVVIGTPSANRGRREIEPLVGLFVNTLALRIDVSDAPSVPMLLARVRTVVLGAQDHQDVPFEQVVEQVNPPRRLEHAPIFQVLFAWQNNDLGTLDLPGLRVDSALNPYDRVKFDLELNLSEVGDSIQGSLDYATDLFDAATMERQGGYLLAMLKAMAAQDEASTAQIDLLAPAERTLLLETWNRTEAPYPAEHGIHQLFEDQVRRTPEATALVFEEQSLSYAALNAQANRLAHYLVGQGVRPDERVAICVERSLAMVVGLLAILKAGGAYVPLDPGYPAERLGQVLGDADPVLVLADASGQAALGEAALRGRVVLELDRPGPAWSDHPATDPDARALGLTSRHLAYVIYTSGSTGTPKGVMVEHRGVVNFLLSMAASPGMSHDDRLLAVTSLSFDIAGLELYLPLSQGAQVVLLAREDIVDPHALQQALLTHRISVMQATPSTWRGLLETAWKHAPGLKILCGGEAMPVELATRLSEQGRSLLNLYGPTETTIWSTCSNVLPGVDRHAFNSSIGRPIANTRLYLLDAYGQPVPLGAVGELYIGGVGVARGYLNRPKLTAERFLADPFCTEPEARMYRTGDLARYLPDGNLVFLGRNDHQVKLRGFRIELGEIEARLVEHPDVREAVVSVREDVPGDKRLIAYVVPKSADELNREDQADGISFSLFYFGADTHTQEYKYDFYLESAKFADQNNFEAIWTPERHFHAVGNLYPNPSILNAALSTITEKVKLRAGSVVLPLHDPIRVAEEWAVVDNLSNGRAGVAIASGWHPRDFSFFPENYVPRKKVMQDGIQTLKSLWRGEKITRTDGNGASVDVQVYPKPVQTELPLWITAAGSPDTFAYAGRLGANVLTHLLGQTIAELAQQIERYRAALEDAGHDPKKGRVTLMVHTFIGEDQKETLDQAKAPFMGYIREHLGLTASIVRELGFSLNDLPEAAKDDIAELAFRRYSQSASLIGTPQSCLPLINQLRDIGVDEIACLVDWMSAEKAKEGLPYLKTLYGLARTSFSGEKLRYHLSRRLPDYMVPTAFVKLDALPLTPNGKIDRKALPAPGAGAYSRRSYEAPQGEAEQILASIWMELFGLDQISRHDHFFELGGHSLMAVRLLGRIGQSFGLELPLATLFAQPTLHGLADAIVTLQTQQFDQSELLEVLRSMEDSSLRNS